MSHLPFQSISVLRLWILSLVLEPNLQSAVSTVLFMSDDDDNDDGGKERGGWRGRGKRRGPPYRLKDWWKTFFKIKVDLIEQLSLAWKNDALIPFYAIRFEFKIFLFIFRPEIHSVVW